MQIWNLENSEITSKLERLPSKYHELINLFQELIDNLVITRKNTNHCVVILIDDDGNEIKTFSKKLVKIPKTEEFTALKTKVYDYDFKKENLIDFAYSRVKNIYETKFGSDNIENLE